MWIRELFAGLLGFASGLAVAGGMFALLIALGVISRFAGKTHTAAYVIHYENAAALGGILGNLFSVYQFRLPIGFPGVIAFGLFSGVFTGTWAMALTEMLDLFPIFIRRIRMVRGTAAVIIGIALGKGLGDLLFFWKRW